MSRWYITDTNYDEKNIKNYGRYANDSSICRNDRFVQQG
jgi:hypothetical protein